MIQQYIDAFERCYPGGRVQVKPTRVKGDPDMHYWVSIDGSKGDRPLTWQDMAEATRLRTAGIAH